MTTTQLKGNQILDGTIKSDDIDDSLEKDFTKVRTTTNDSTADFLSSKIIAGDNINVSVTGASGSNQTLTISATGGIGSQGYQGNVGAQGSQGSIGSQGTQGSQGYQGPAGQQGQQGYQGTTGTSGDNFFSSVVNDSIITTGSLILKGQESITSSTEKGQDVFFYVSGTIGSLTSPKVSLFGGDVISSGTLSVANGMTVVGNSLISGDSAVLGTFNVLQDANVDGKLTVTSSADFSGSIKFANGLSGSLTRLADGTSYLIAGSNVEINTGSNGSVIISSSVVESQGFQGFQGNAGVQGSTGFQGSAGSQGQQGFQGAQGTAGLQGSQGASGTGTMTLIETKTLSSTGSVVFSSLNGDSDKTYILEGEITVSSGANIEIHPNENSGNVMMSAYITNSSGSPTPAGGNAVKLSMPLGSSVSSGERFQFTTRIIADSRGSTLAPLFQTICINDATSGGGAIRQQTISSAFTSKSAITSLKIISTGGNMTGRVSLYKITS